jgi:hypothetical protein
MQINLCPMCGRDHFADVGKKVVSARDEAVAKWNELTNKIKGE